MTQRQLCESWRKVFLLSVLVALPVTNSLPFEIILTKNP